MNESKGIQIGDLFTYVGIAFMGLFAFSRIGSVITEPDTFILFLALVDVAILIGYVGLLKKRKIGLIILVCAILIYAITQEMITTGGLFISIFSPETLLSLVVICGMIPKLKTLQ